MFMSVSSAWGRLLRCAVLVSTLGSVLSVVSSSVTRPTRSTRALMSLPPVISL